MGLSEKIKFAFSTGTEEEFKPTEKQKEVADFVTSEVVRRQMASPALLFLETIRPLNFIGSQVMHYFQPIVSAILTTDRYSQFASFLEHRKSVDYLCERIEFYENEKDKKDRLSSEKKKDPKPIETELPE